VTRFKSTLFLTLIATLAVIGCSSAPTTSYYTLNTLPAATAHSSSDLVLAIGPIDLPEYLQRPQIVTRPEGNRLLVDEFNRWGGSLEEEIDRVLAQRLGGLLGTQRIYSYPSRIVADLDYRVSINVRAFDGTLGQTVTFDVAWSIINEHNSQVIHSDQAHYQATVTGSDYNAYVAALSDSLEQFSHDLAVDVAAVTR